MDLQWTLPAAAAVELIAVDGRMLLRQPLPAGTQATRLDLSGIPAGTYCLIVRSKEGASTHHLMVR